MIDSRCRRWRSGRFGAVAFALFLASLSIAGCAAYSGTPAEKVQEWVSQNSFVANHNLLVSDISSLRKAVRIGQAKTVRTICGGFAYDIGTAYDTLPTPDETLTNDLNDADTVFLKAATTCGDVGSVLSPQMSRADAEIDAGLTDLGKARQRLSVLGIEWRVHL